MNAIAIVPLLLSSWFSVAVQDPAPEPNPVVVTGMMLDGELKPAAGVAVAILGADDDVAAALASPLARSGPDGRFRVAVGRERRATATLVLGGGSWATMQGDIDLATGDFDVGTLTIAAGTKGAGRVRAADGTPVEGALVTAEDLLDSRSFLKQRSPFRCRSSARSGRGGIFTLPGMLPSAVRLRVQKAGCYDTVLQPVGAGAPLDATLEPAPAYRVRVVDEVGAPIEKAWVTVGGQRLETDVEGRVAIHPREPGATTVQAVKEVEGQWRNATKDLARVGDEVVVQLTAPAPTPAAKGTLRVLARDPDGRGVASFAARLTWQPPDQLRYRPDAMLLVDSQSGSWDASATDGTATLSGANDAPDRNRAGIVFVRAAGFALARAEVAPTALGGELVVDLKPECVVSGRVVDDQSGAPIVGAIVVPTQNLTADERGHYGRGFRSVVDLGVPPTATRTDADGRFELRGVPAGDGDLFVRVDGRIELPPIQLTLADGERRNGVEFRVPANVDLRASFARPVVAGARVRLHWDRPNMWSSSWCDEYDGAVEVAADGSFAVAGNHPKPYVVQLIAPQFPRGGRPLKIAGPVWDGAAPPAAPPTYECPGPVAMHGSVGGPVPWHRLAVAAMWPDGDHHHASSFEVDGALALVERDRRFRIGTPKGKGHLVLFDVLTGAVLSWQEVDAAADPKADVRFDGAAVAVELEIAAGDGVPRRAGSVDYKPDAEHFPSGIGDIQRLGGRSQRSGMRTDARIGDVLTVWLPARVGTLTLAFPPFAADVDLEKAAPGAVRVVVDR